MTRHAVVAASGTLAFLCDDHDQVVVFFSIVFVA